MTIPYCQFGYWISSEGIVHDIPDFEAHDCKANELGFDGCFGAWDAGWASITVSINRKHAGLHVPYAPSGKQISAILRIARQHEWDHMQLRNQSCTSIIGLARLLRDEMNAPKEVHGNLKPPGRF